MRLNKAASRFYRYVYLQKNKSCYHISSRVIELMDVFSHNSTQFKHFYTSISVLTSLKTLIPMHTTPWDLSSQAFRPLVKGLGFCVLLAWWLGTCAASTVPVCNAEAAAQLIPVSQSLSFSLFDPGISVLVIWEMPRWETATLFTPLLFECMWTIFMKSYF